MRSFETDQSTKAIFYLNKNKGGKYTYNLLPIKAADEL